MKLPIRHLLQATALLAACFAIAPPLLAVVDDAHSFAMAAAEQDAIDGFAVRDDYWSGEMKSGGRELIRHQLFKGNEYAFWLGVDTDSECVLDIKIYDSQGKRVGVTAVSDGRTSKIHISPPKTGSYFIVVTATKKGGGEIPWALAYGYR